MQIAASESMWPVLGAVKWVKNFAAAVATSITAGNRAGVRHLGLAACGHGKRGVLLVAALLGDPVGVGILAIPAAATAARSAPLSAYSVGIE
jgi:hypothetical protein